MASPRALADQMAGRHGWETIRIDAGGFRLHGYRRIDDPALGWLTVYIEGDGYAWVSEFELSRDPTPLDPVALALAVRDPSPNRLYLARPCQYQSAPMLARCHPRYWSDARYGEAVVAAMDAAIDRANRTIGAHRLRLVGYSGGGAVAALVAARRTDVAQLITVAATLDHAAWTRMKGVSALDGSLNPADHTAALEDLPQVHFVGEDDDVVPPAVARSYLARMRDRSSSRIVTVPGADHDCCWPDRWPALLAAEIDLAP